MSPRALLKGVLFVFAIVGALIVASGCGSDTPKPRTLSPAERLTVQQLVGQRIVAGFTGTKPPKKLLIAIKQGAVGGVILFADNTPSKKKTQRLTQRLQHTALVAKQPYLLVMTDQEGGDVKRLAWAPPKHSPQATGRKSDVAAAAQGEGTLTGAALRAAGVNVNLAPVADVVGNTVIPTQVVTAATGAGGATGPTAIAEPPGTFLGTRSYGSDAKTVAVAACAFSTGLQNAAVAATMKHFPGLGLATTNTDFAATEITASTGALRTGWRPYEHCPSTPKLVMVSSAKYPALNIDKPASLTPEAYKLLAGTGFKGATITDAYDTVAMKDYDNAPQRAMAAGVDLVLFGQKTGTATRAYDKILAAAQSGQISKKDLQAHAAKILSLKHQLQSGAWTN
jgi:beta-N-acetylhexosaminidase